MLFIVMCAGSAENQNDENKMTHHPILRNVDIEVYLFQECQCVLSL